MMPRRPYRNRRSLLLFRIISRSVSNRGGTCQYESTHSRDQPNAPPASFVAACFTPGRSVEPTLGRLAMFTRDAIGPRKKASGIRFIELEAAILLSLQSGSCKTPTEAAAAELWHIEVSENCTDTGAEWLQLFGLAE